MGPWRLGERPADSPESYGWLKMLEVHWDSLCLHMPQGKEHRLNYKWPWTAGGQNTKQYLAVNGEMLETIGIPYVSTYPRRNNPLRCKVHLPD